MKKVTFLEKISLKVQNETNVLFKQSHCTMILSNMYLSLPPIFRVFTRFLTLEIGGTWKPYLPSKSLSWLRMLVDSAV